MASATAIKIKPELTMPEKEAALLLSAYSSARSILEYGAGGSTVVAGNLPGKTVISVETDKDWVDALNGWFDANPPLSQVDVVWANIGKTRDWGRPASESAWRDFVKYPLEIWDLDGVPHPDVVLVDGRFRAGCVLATAIRCTQPVRVLVDDYKNRPAYHVVEPFVGKPKFTGRMAEFHLTPLQIDPKDLLRIIQILQNPY
jgi:hypothetical protein